MNTYASVANWKFEFLIWAKVGGKASNRARYGAGRVHFDFGFCDVNKTIKFSFAFIHFFIALITYIFSISSKWTVKKI